MKNIKIPEAFNRKNDLLQFKQQFVHSAVSAVYVLYLQSFFHHRKCKKY